MHESEPEIDSARADAIDKPSESERGSGIPLPALHGSGVITDIEKKEIANSLSSTLEAIRNSSPDAFQAFLISDLREYRGRDALPNSIAEAILEKGYQIWEEAEKRDKDTHDLIYALDHAIIGSTRGAGRAFVDVGFESFFRLYEKHPEASMKLWEMLAQNGHMVEPEILINGIVDTLWRPNVSPRFKQHVVHDINYLYAFHGDGYNEAFIKNLDFKNPDHYFRTGIFLEFLKELHALSGWWSFSEERRGPERIQTALEQAAENKEGSYLLQLRAQEILDLMQHNETTYHEDLTLPFLLTHHTFAFTWNNRVFTAPIKSFEKMREKLAAFRNLEEGMLNWEDEHGHVQNKQMIQTWKTAQKEIFSLLTHELIIEDLAISRPDKTAEQLERDQRNLSDYRYMARFPVRNTLEREFGFCVADLPFREQFYFLQFIKAKNADEVEPVKKFAKKFGLNGLRAFLALEYNPDFGKKILELGSDIPEREAAQLFALYARVLDGAEQLSGLLNNSATFQDAKGHAPELLFIKEVHEAVVRRSVDLLLAAHRIGVEHHSGDLDIEAVMQALEGLAVFFDALGSIVERPDDAYSILDAKRLGDTFAFEIEHKETRIRYQLRAFVRPYEEVISVGRGITRNAQARINLELDFNTKQPNSELQEAFRQTILFKNRNELQKISRLRVGIDRDTYTDPPLISLDMGRDRRDGELFQRSGDVLGRLLTIASEMGHHNQKSFDQNLAKLDIFGSVAERIKHYLESKMKTMRKK